MNHNHTVLFKTDFSVFTENEDTTGSLFEILGGWAAQTRWQRAGGHGFPIKTFPTPEDIVSKWANITNFSQSRQSWSFSDFCMLTSAFS